MRREGAIALTCGPFWPLGERYSAVGKVLGQTPKHTKYATFQDAPAVEYLIALLFSKILKIRYYLEFNILRW